MAMHNAQAKPADLLKDIDGVAKAAKGEPMKAAADYAGAIVRSAQPGFDWLKAIKDFRSAHPASKHYEALVTRAVFEVTKDQKRELIAMFVKDFPDHRFAPMLKGQLRQLDAVGKPFELAFEDAVTGKKVDIKDLMGKVVMIDWWATWCGPCVAEMPHVKEVYKKYKDQGFEIIGISLDQPEAQGGLGALKEFVAKNEVPWPQYYQGNGWDSEFSSSWGIMSIPNVFLIDKQGVLREIEVADLEASLLKLLKE
jgi:thiol-disulfide isomerase/thioredoxin